MELIIITIIGIVLFISICICVCILGQTIMSKRRQPQHIMHPHFNTDTLHPQGGCIIDEGQMATSWIVYPGENPESTARFEESRVLLPGNAKMSTVHETDPKDTIDAHEEDDYTSPILLKQMQPNESTRALPPLPRQTTEENRLAEVDCGYTAPVIGTTTPNKSPIRAQQEMPEYTLPVKKQKQEQLSAQSAEDSQATDDYLLPSTMRPEPIGANPSKVLVVEESPHMDYVNELKIDA